jgi:hypothetical protein
MGPGLVPLARFACERRRDDVKGGRCRPKTAPVFCARVTAALPHSDAADHIQAPAEPGLTPLG